MVSRALDAANAREVTNAAEQLVPGSISAKIGAMGTALSRRKVKRRRAGRGEAVAGERIQLA
jgi:hypothetical protein